MKISLNLERIVSIVLILAISIWGVKQCSIKTVYKKSCETKDKKIETLKTEGIKLANYYEVQKDSAKYFETKSKQLQVKLNQRNAKIKQIESIYDTLITKWGNSSTEDRKHFLDSLFRANGGQNVTMDSSQIQQIGYAILEGNECLNVRPQLEFQLDIIQEDLDACNSGYTLEQKINSELQQLNTDAKKQSEDLILKNKILKKKNLWKTVYGIGVTGILILVAI